MKSLPPITKEERLSYLENLLIRNDSYEGLDAFVDLCNLGCDKSMLSFHLLRLGDRNEHIIDVGKERIDKVYLRPLEGLETALYPFHASSIRDLKILAKRTQKLIEDIDKLKQSPLIQEFIEMGKFRPGDLLSGLPFVSRPLFEGLLNLPSLVKELDFRNHPEYSRLLIDIQNYILSCTGKLHDK